MAAAGEPVRAAVLVCEGGRQVGRGQVRVGVRLALRENREFFERLGYRQVGLDSHAGPAVPTFAWFAKLVG